MIESALVYGFLTIIMVVCGVYASRRQLAFERRSALLRHSRTLSFAYLEIWLPILLFTVVFGCRYDVGRDQLEYLKWYFEGVPDNKEFLWRFFATVFSNCGIHYAVYFSLWAFLQVFLLYYTIKNYRYLFPYIAFYLIVGNYFLAMMNTIRFSLVACVFFYSIQYIIDKHFIKYCLCILVSTLIHKTAIVLIVFYPIFRYKETWFNIKTQIIILSVSLVLLFNREVALNIVSYVFSYFVDMFHYEDGYSYAFYNPKYGLQLFNQSAQFGRNTGLGEYVILFLGIMIMLFQKNMKAKYNSHLYNISYSLWFLAFAAGIVAGKSFVLSRPLLYLAPFKMIVLAYFTHYCFSSKKVKEQIIGGMFVLIHLVLFINIISMGEANKAAFSFFWQH